MQPCVNLNSSGLCSNGLVANEITLQMLTQPARHPRTQLYSDWTRQAISYSLYMAILQAMERVYTHLNYQHQKFMKFVLIQTIKSIMYFDALQIMNGWQRQLRPV